MINIEHNGLTEIWSSENDFLLWADIIIKDRPTLHTQDKIRVAVNQALGIYKQTCTMMSTYSAILSLYNMEVDEKLKKKIVMYAVENEWYEIGKGWRLKQWVDAACHVRNEEHPDKKVMYVRSVIGNDDFNQALWKWYPAIMGYKTSTEYALDKSDDGIVSIKDATKFRGGHAITGYKSEQGNDWMHLNTYPNRKHNEYEVKNGIELMKNNVYFNSTYFILPTNDLWAHKKKKFLKASRLLTGYTRGLLEDRDNIFNAKNAELYLDKIQL